MLVTDVGILTLAKELHPEKVCSPMLVTDVGISTLAKELHPEKAPSPMLVTDVGISTFAKELHSKKAHAPILVTDVGMSTLAKERHPSKASIPMLVTVVGIVTLVTLVLSTSHPAHEPSFALQPPVMLTVPSGTAKCKPPSSSDGSAAAAVAIVWCLWHPGRPSTSALPVPKSALSPPFFYGRVCSSVSFSAWSST